MSRPDEEAVIRALALPDPELDLPVDLATVVITDHAIRRYRERVEGVPRKLAVRRLRDLVATAEWRRRPSPGMPIVLRAHVIYGYIAVGPNLCLILRNRALVSVLVDSADDGARAGRTADPGPGHSRISEIRRSRRSGRAS